MMFFYPFAAMGMAAAIFPWLPLAAIVSLTNARRNPAERMDTDVDVRMQHRNDHHNPSLGRPAGDLGGNIGIIPA